MAEPKTKILVTVDEDLLDIIPGYLERRHGDAATITGALAQGDYEQILRIGHSMKGSGGAYGFEAITTIGAALEQAAKRQDSRAIEEQLRVLQDYLERVEIASA